MEYEWVSRIRNKRNLQSGFFGQSNVQNQFVIYFFVQILQDCRVSAHPIFWQIENVYEVFENEKNEEKTKKHKNTKKKPWKPQ